MRAVKKGLTDQSTVIRIIDSTVGTPETGVTSVTAGLDLQYRREGGTVSSLTESDLAALDSAHADGGMLHIGAGYYRLDLPDAAFATGANGVLVFGTVTGMVVIGSYHPLVDYDPQDTVRLGLTALPNAAADAAGGLPISDAGGLDMDAILSRIGVNTDAATDPSAASGSLFAKIRGAGNDLDTIDDFLDTEIAAILAAVDTEVAAILADTGTDGVVVAAASKTGYQLSAAGVDDIFDEVVEGSYTLRQYLRGYASALLGELAGAATVTVTVRDTADTKDRITATVDADGNRSAVTLDLT